MECVPAKPTDMGTFGCLSTYVLGSAKSDSGNARDASEVQLLNSLASLLLVAVVDYGSRASRQVALAILGIGLVAAVLLLLDSRSLSLLIRELLDSGVGHFLVD